MGIYRIILIVITSLILIFNMIINTETDEEFKNKLLTNCLFMLYLLYLIAE